MSNSIRTDLAAERRELNPEISGVTEENETKNDVAISRIRIENEEASKKLEKPIGNYITLDVPKLVERSPELFKSTAQCISEEIKHLTADIKKDAVALVVGLGNRFITPDSLGPRVVEHIYITRHITEYMPEITDHALRPVCAVAPGVLGITGIETLEVVRGVAEHVKPDVIIVIDALASMRAARISTTIQLTDTGICPGGGIGNARAEFNEKVFGVPVIAIGVPLVVFASTVARDTISLIADKTGLHSDEQKLLELADKVIEESMGPMIVTPKDIDSLVDDMSKTVADGINIAMHDVNYDEVKMLLV